MSSFEGKVAVITGAGSGIGRALALNLSEKRAKLALSDVDTDGLAKTVRLAQALGAQVKSDRLDVAEREAVLAHADAVVAHFGTVHQVYNNAGIAYNGNVDKSEFKDIERIIDVDFWGVVNGTKAFLPHVIASGDGHIVNISSLFGLIAVPGQSAYNAAKFAVRGFTEALRQEMLVARHPVKVTCVHPGGIKTAVARNATGPTARTSRRSRSSSTAGWRCIRRRWPPKPSSTESPRARPASWSAWRPKPSMCSRASWARRISGWLPPASPSSSPGPSRPIEF